MDKLYYIHVQDEKFRVEESKILDENKKFIKTAGGSVSKSTINTVRRYNFDSNIHFDLYCTNLEKGIELISRRISERIAHMRGIAFQGERMLNELKDILKGDG